MVRSFLSWCVPLQYHNLLDCKLQKFFSALISTIESNTFIARIDCLWFLNLLILQLISETAGTIFVFVLFASILGTMIYSVAIIYDAGDDDDGGCGDDSSGDDSTSSMLFKSFFRLMKSR